MICLACAKSNSHQALGRIVHANPRQANEGQIRFRGPQARSDSEVSLGPVVEDQDESTSDTAQDVCHETLVQARGEALLCGDLLETVPGAFVEMLLRRLLGLHLQAP